MPSIGCLTTVSRNQMAVPNSLALVTTTGALSVVDPDPDQAMKSAVADFEDALSPQQRRKLRDHISEDRTDADAVLVFTAKLDAEKRDKRTGRSTATRLHSFLSAIAVFCDIVHRGKNSSSIDTFVSSHPEIAALVWGSIKLTMSILIDFRSFYDGTVKLLMTIAQLCPLVSEYRPLYPESQILQASLSAFFASIILCCKHLVEELNRSSLVKFGRSFVTSFDQEFEPHLNEIRKCHKRVKESLNIAQAKAVLRHQQLQAAESAAAESSRARFTKLLRGQGNSLHRMESLQIQEANYKSARRVDELLDTISVHDFMRPFRQNSQKRYSNTTEWVFESPEFQGWLNGEVPILWCSGKIGSGKTVVCSSAIQHMQHVKGSLGHPIVFFFAESLDATSLNACDIMKSLLLQRLRSTKITQDMERSIRALSLSSTALDIAKLLRDTMPNSLRSYIFVDGLDECATKDRRELLQALSYLISLRGSNIRLFLSSRPSLHDEIRKRFPEFKSVSLDCEATNRDIATYVEGFLKEELDAEAFKVGDATLIIDIKKALTKGAQGMFLWAYYQLQDICAQHNDEDIRSTLANLPKDLAETFGRLLIRIESRKRGDAARNVFLWVAASKRPLSLYELREAIAVRIGQQYTIPERLSNDIDRIASWCENLVQVEEESQVVQFAHSAIRTFLLGDSDDHVPEPFRISLRDADHTVGEMCVTYLDFNDFKTAISKRPDPLLVSPAAFGHGALRAESRRSQALSRYLRMTRPASYDMRPNLEAVSTDTRSNTSTLKANHPFLDYASIYWLEHTTCFQENTSKTWSLWQQMITADRGIGKLPFTGKFSEIAAWRWAYLHRHSAMMRLLCMAIGPFKALEYWMQARCSFYDVQLFEFVFDLHSLQPRFLEEFLRLTTDFVLEVLDGELTQDGHGQKDIIYRLLLAGADRDGTFLLEKVLGESDGEELILLSRGGETYAQIHLDDALLGACIRGHEWIVWNLLGKGANPNVNVRCGQDVDIDIDVEEDASPSVRAARRIRLFSEREGHVLDELGDCHGIALNAASREGYLGIVRILLDEGANVNACGFYSDTALQIAAFYGHERIVALLLSRNANVNSPAGTYGSALKAARGHGRISAMLKQRSAKWF